ncbi:MAG: hypothetical protein HY300_10510 [Verrucomicrobia bacterium]|nr:hypothetical protein [Verrucomicrobiota bacterium]
MTLALALAVSLEAAVTAQAQSTMPVEAGPLAHQARLTLAPGERAEILGPLISHESSDARTFDAWHPFFSLTRDDELELTELDVLYPALTYRRFGAEYRWQLFQWLSWSGGQSQQEVEARRFTLFPFYFQQRSPDPARNYTAFIPFYGHLKNRLLRDEIDFALMPLYVKSRKKDVVTANYLYPFFHLRHGDALAGWQFWPLLGYETKGVTTKTNVADEVETICGHRKFFFAWQFFLDQKTGLGTDNPAHQQAFVPLYSWLRSPQRDSTTYLWPFGLTITDDREKKYREIGAPWPLIVFTRGEGKTTTRVWPLFSHAHNDVLESDFFLWPLWKYNRAAAEPLFRERTRILLFLYSDLTEKNTDTGAALRRTDLWPLFTARRDLEGNERLQVFAPIEPILPNNKSIERDWSPLWSIWRSEKNAKTGEASESGLWNFYRADTTKAERKCSLLFGLVHYQSDTNGSHWRLLRPMKKAPPEPPATEAKE